MATRLPKSVLVLLSAICTSYAAFSQVGTLNAVQQPLSPNAAAFGKFVEVPVGHFTGTPQLNVPLYELKTKDFNIPISLSYHASGIKVAEIPSWVGAGFLLNAGGAIIRVVRDLPDGIDAPGWHDLANPSYKGQIDYYEAPGHYWPDGRMNSKIVAEGSFSKIDMQFDDFYYNFMGYTGSFIFNNQGTAMMKIANGMKAEYASEYFKLTDPNGIVYEFNEYETQSFSPHWYISTWYLTKATNPFKNETVEFKYDQFGLIAPYRTSYGPDTYEDQVLTNDRSPHSPPGIDNPQCEDEGTRMGEPNQLNGDNLFLKQIIYKTDTVNFYPNMTNRTDVYKVRLDSIKVYSSSGLINKTSFAYTYSDTVATDPLQKKMLLKSVKINDQTPYSFDYYGSYMGRNMPGILAEGADTWGYYNGENSPFFPNGKRALWRYSFMVPNSDLLYGRNSSYRNPDWKYGQIGSLKSISYPTGGKTELEYEGHDYADFNVFPATIIRLDSISTAG